MAGAPTFENTTATLTLSTGYEVALSPGTAKVLTGLEGWIKPAAMRRKKTERAGAHGSFSERGWRDERLVTVSGHYYAASRGEAAAFADEIAAFLGDGTEGVFHVDDVDLGDRWAKVYLSGDPDVAWDGGLDVYFTIDLAAPDPRKYGQSVSTTTGVQSDGGGLAFDLFAGAPYTEVRRNRITNPSAESGSTTGWEYPTQVSISTVSMTSPVGSAAFRALVTAGTAGSMTQRVDWLRSTSAAPGVTYTFSAWLKPSKSTDKVALRIYFMDAGGFTLSSFGSSDATGSAFTRVSATGTAPAGTVAIYCRVGNSGNTIAIGESFYWDGAMLEESAAMGDYFDGDQPAPLGFINQWTDTPKASASIQSSIDGVEGVLDFGEAGSPGTATFTNTGTADSAALLRVDGYAPGFEIIEATTGRRLVYTAEVLTGQYLILNPNDGTVKLNGYADRSEFLTVREWTRTEGGATSTFYFQTAGPNALLTVEGVPAWW